MLIDNRVIFKDNTTFTDISEILSDQFSGEFAFAIVASEDALYVGSDYPFNSRFFLPTKKNTVAGTVAVAIWTGSAFTACEDVKDLTSIGGVPFSRSGLIRWDLPDNVGWSKVANASEISELSTLKSRANYWAKFTFSAAFDFELKYLGFAFSKDNDLQIYYRDLLNPDRMRDLNGGSFMQTYDKFHIAAAEEVIRDLRKKEKILSGNNILDPENFTDCAVHKLAEMVYSQMQNEERLDYARSKYREALDKVYCRVDLNMDGRLQSYEKTSTGRLRRV